MNLGESLMAMACSCRGRELFSTRAGGVVIMRKILILIVLAFCLVLGACAVSNGSHHGSEDNRRYETKNTNIIIDKSDNRGSVSTGGGTYNRQ